MGAGLYVPSPLCCLLCGEFPRRTLLGNRVNKCRGAANSRRTFSLAERARLAFRASPFLRHRPCLRLTQRQHIVFGYTLVHSNTVEFYPIEYRKMAETDEGSRQKGSRARGRAVRGVARHGGGRRVPRRGAGDGLPLVPGREPAVFEDRTPLARPPGGAGGVHKEERTLSDADGAAARLPGGARQRAGNLPESPADAPVGRRLLPRGRAQGRDASQVPP